MRRGYIGLPLLAAALLGSPLLHASTIWSNVTVVTDTAGYDTISPCCQVQAITDEEGLITPYTNGQDWTTYFAGTPLHTDEPINFSGNVDGSQDYEWFSADQGTAGPTANLVLDLGSEIPITNLAIWNVDILNMTVEVCTGYTGGTSSTVGTLTGCTEANGAAFTGLTPNGLGPSPSNYAAQTFSFAQVTGRYVELQLTANNSPIPGGTGNYDTSLHTAGQYQLSMGSIAFGTTIPEPSSGVLLGLGLAVLGLGRMAWQRRVVKSSVNVVN